VLGPWSLVKGPPVPLPIREHKILIERRGGTWTRDQKMLRRSSRRAHDLNCRVAYFLEKPVERRSFQQDLEAASRRLAEDDVGDAFAPANAIKPSDGRSAVTRTTVAPRLSASEMFRCSGDDLGVRIRSSSLSGGGGVSGAACRA
jgi:hypothetical protein